MKKGDKYIIEIAEVHTHYDDNGKAYPIARIKGFSALTFDKKGLNKLTKVNDANPTEYLNCRFVVTGYMDVCPIGTRVGGLYEVRYGKFKVDDGRVFPITRSLKDVEDLKYYMKYEYDGIDICVIED